jgi:hypothetical protein
MPKLLCECYKNAKPLKDKWERRNGNNYQIGIGGAKCQLVRNLTKLPMGFSLNEII